MSDDERGFANWLLPEMEETETQGATETSLFGKPAAWYSSEKPKIEAEEFEEQATPLTLEDIEAIRLSAYEDGFKEGQAAGFNEGQEEGKAAGFIDGEREGRKQGLNKGLAEGKVHIEEQVTHWQALIERLHNPLAKLDDSVEYQLVRLATNLAEQIARCEVQSNPQIILQALKQAVEALPVSEQTLRILLHPDDLQFVQAAYSPELCLKRGWDLQGEPALARGDCQIHTKVSSVDYAFSHRVEQVLKHFFKENYQQLPEKNDDSNLLNTQPISTQYLHSETTQATDLNGSAVVDNAENIDSMNE